MSEPIKIHCDFQTGLVMDGVTVKEIYNAHGQHYWKATSKDTEILRLREALKPFAGLELREEVKRHPETPVYAMNKTHITGIHVIDAREALAQEKGEV